MPGFELILPEVYPFAGIDLAIDVRVCGTYADLDNYDLDLVEVPRRYIPGSHDASFSEWRVIDRLHPLYRGSSLNDGIGRFLDRRETLDRIEAEIRRLMEEDGQLIVDPNAEHRLGRLQLLGAA